MVWFTKDRDKNRTVRKSNTELVYIDGFGFGDAEVVGESVERVIASGAEVLKMLRMDVAWVSGNVKWEKGSQKIVV